MEEIIKRKEKLGEEFNKVQELIKTIRRDIKTSIENKKDYLPMENQLNELRLKRKEILNKIYILNEAFNVLNEI